MGALHAVLDRHGLVTRRKRRRYRAEGTALSRPTTPNALWCADYKGEFMLADRRPVGLLFAGTAVSTLANPIDLVLVRFAVQIDGR